MDSTPIILRFGISYGGYTWIKSSFKAGITVHRLSFTSGPQREYIEQVVASSRNALLAIEMKRPTNGVDTVTALASDMEFFKTQTPHPSVLLHFIYKMPTEVGHFVNFIKENVVISTRKYRPTELLCERLAWTYAPMSNILLDVRKGKDVYFIVKTTDETLKKDDVPTTKPSVYDANAYCTHMMYQLTREKDSNRTILTDFAYWQLVDTCKKAGNWITGCFWASCLLKELIVHSFRIRLPSLLLKPYVSIKNIKTFVPCKLSQRHFDDDGTTAYYRDYWNNVNEHIGFLGFKTADDDLRRIVYVSSHIVPYRQDDVPFTDPNGQLCNFWYPLFIDADEWNKRGRYYYHILPNSEDLLVRIAEFLLT